MRKLLSLMLFLVVTMLCLHLTVQNGYSASMKLLDLEGLVERADCIVVGTCVETQSSWDDEKRLIYTTVTVKVSECLKESGASKKAAEGQRLTLKIYGGTIKDEDIGMIVSGEAAFHVNEEIALFLRSGRDTRLQSAGRSYFRPVGGAQGKYTVFTDKGGGKSVRKNSGSQKSEAEKRSASDAPGMSLEEFKKQVKSYLEK